jgi:eukaryotic-like serine/threonine-protein kinase
MDQPTSNGNKPTDDISGKTLGDFHIVRRIGQGGMGQVYLAEQTSLKRKVALKFLRPDLAANQVALGRFRTEAESVAKINHPNIVQVFTVGQHDSMQFMALEYVEGMNLRDYLTKKGTPDLQRALLIMRQVAAALQRASETGIVHRDIKPENILLTRKGEVKVTDFGLSRVFGTDDNLNLTKSGMTMGTPLYMSPEQVQGQAVDPRSDIYSFGVTCYHLLAGQPPFTGQNAFEVALKHVNEKPRPVAELRPDLPAELCQLVDRMMLKDPAQRPQSGREVLKVLNNLRGQTTENTLAEMPMNISVPATTSPSAGSAAPISLSWPTTTTHNPAWKTIGIAGLAILLGAVTRWGISPANSPVDPSSQPSVEVNADEKYMLDTARQANAVGLTSPTNLQIAYRANVGVVAHYLDQHRYSEADEFINQMNATEPGIAFFKTLFHGMLFAFEDEPDKAINNLRMAFADANNPKYLNYVFSPRTRESVDLRSLMVEALDRVSKSHALPPELLVVRREWDNALRRSPSTQTKGK